MKILLSILSCCLLFPWLSLASVDGRESPSIKEGLLAGSVKEGQGAPEPQEKKSSKAIEDYEKEKLAKYQRNIGKRFLAVQTVRPPVFFESPDDLKRKIKVREKEEFRVIEVVQNQSGTMNFYKVKLESGKIGYLGADGNNLEIRVKDGSLIPITPKVGKRSRAFREEASRAIDLVKNTLIPSDPVSKDKRSIERRMLELRASSYPKLKWRYEAKKIGSPRYRVSQVSEGESPRPIVRTWVVDLSARKVIPENQAARDLYRF
ncbi:MAG: hypothetical protein ACUVWO_07185 [Thermodesulfobacteriota bacterium]